MGALSWKQYFIYQADYQHWANEVLFECLDRLDPKALAEPQGLSLLDHTPDRGPHPGGGGIVAAAPAGREPDRRLQGAPPSRTGAS
jgi:hypothetical protein